MERVRYMDEVDTTSIYCVCMAGKDVPKYSGTQQHLEGVGPRGSLSGRLLGVPPRWLAAVTARC